MKEQTFINYNHIASAIDYIKDHFNEQPNLDDVAEKVHLSPFHFQRLFSEWAGVSPKKFLQYLTVEHAKKILKMRKGSLSDAAYETGLSGTGRLHDLFVNIEGMTPGEYRNGGASLTIHWLIGNSLFGKYIAASTGKGICNLSFFEGTDADPIAGLKTKWPNAGFVKDTDAQLMKIEKFFSRDATDPAGIKLHLKGTPFQLKVWQALLQVREGDVST